MKKEAKQVIYTKHISLKLTDKQYKRLLEKMRNAPNENRLGLYADRYNNVEASVVTAEVVANAKEKVKELRRQRQNLQDKLLALNVNTLITISPEDLVVLKEEGIL